MTRFDDLDRALATFFDGEAAAPAPAGLLEKVTATTAMRRPRQTWHARLRTSTGSIAQTSQPVSRALLVGIALLLALATAAIVGSQLFPRPTTILGIFEPTGAITNQTAHFAAPARLTDGRVILAGGLGNVTLFDPALGSFSTVSTPGLYSHAAIAGADDSALLFGQDIREADATPGMSVVRFDGRTGSASPILASSTAFGDVSAESAFVGLSDGRVLILGQSLTGADAGSAATMVYDPRTTTFVRGPVLPALQGPARAFALPDGWVLSIAAADDDGAAPQAMALLDPLSGTVAPAGTIDGRDACTWTILADGRILVAGGVSSADGGRDQTVLDTGLVIDLRGATVTVTPTGRLPQGRWMHGAALLADGRVLLVGGDLAPATLFAATPSTVLYDPATNAFASGPAMLMARVAPKVVSLADGRVLVAGHYGLAPNAPATGAELTAEVFR